VEGYRSFLRELAELDLAGQVAPVQLAIRLLIPAGSLLMELAEVRGMVEPFDPRGLCYPWRHEDPEVDRVWAGVQEVVKRGERRKTPRGEIIRQVWEVAGARELPVLADRATIPYLTEPWYC
jgi:hypothetical protein